MRSPVFAVLISVLLVPTVSRATVPGDLCTGNPCIISANANIDDGSNLDFGAVDLIIEEDVVLSVDGSGPYLDIEADSIVMEPGATIKATTPGDTGLSVSMVANDGNVEVQAAGAKQAEFELQGSPIGSGGDFTVYVDAGDLLFDGSVTTGAGFSGAVDFDAPGDVRVADIDTHATAAFDAVGGYIEIDAGGRIDITGNLNSGAGGGDGSEGADQYISAGTHIQSHPGSKVDVSSSGAGGVTGLLTWNATTGDIIHEGQMIGNTASSFEVSEGAYITADAGGSITITGLVDFTAGNNGNGYDSNFTAGGDITVQALMKAGSKGPQGLGGKFVLSGQHVSVQEDMDVSGGGQGTDGISIQAVLSATIDAKLKAGAGSGGDAGSIEVEGCDVTITSGAKLEASAGSTGTIRLEGGRRVRVDGQLKAGAGNTVEYDLNYPELLGTVTPTATITQTADSSACGPLALCGNDLLDIGEQCDDGNTTDGDCCSMACAAETLGNPCGVDWGLCATNQCDGLGACGIATPGASCFQTIDSLKSQLQISDKAVDKGDLVSFRWLRGDEALLGALPDPVNTDDVELCVYGPAGQPILRLRAPAGGTCGTKPCWSAKSTGYKYADKERTPDGVIKVQLKAGEALKGKADLKAKGENVPDLPSLPLALPVTAQLQASNGACWQASFSSPGAIKNTPEQFKGRSD